MNNEQRLALSDSGTIDRLNRIFSINHFICGKTGVNNSFTVWTEWSNSVTDSLN